MVVINILIIYNKVGDYDFNGIIFVFKEDVDDILCGKLNFELLILCGNVGECV